MDVQINVNVESFDNPLADTQLFKILDKFGIKDLSIQRNNEPISGKSANNASRSKFSKFCKDNGFKRVGAKNAFEFSGKVFGFSVVSGSRAECRQFGENYSGLVCNFKNHTKWYSREQLILGDVTRIGPDGVKYFNVIGETTEI